MRILVVYYSFEGNTRFIAEAIASAIGADVLQLRRVKEIGTHGFMKFFLGGREVLMRKKPKLHPFDKDPADYDLLFIGTPVWSWNFAPPLRTFFKKVKLKGKKIALFCCCAGQKGRVFKKMKAELQGNEFVGEMDFIEPLKKGKDVARHRAAEWAEEIVNMSSRCKDSRIESNSK